MMKRVRFGESGTHFCLFTFYIARTIIKIIWYQAGKDMVVQYEDRDIA